MKIAYISQSYPPMISGASIVVKRLAEGMSRRGHTVMVMAASDRGDAYTRQSSNLRVVRLKSIPNPKRAYQQFVPWSFKAIRSQINGFQPDLIHIHDVLMLGVCGLVVGKQMNIPVIGTIHQLPWFISVYLPDIPGLKPSIESCLWKYSCWLDKQCQTMIVPTETISRTVKHHAGFQTVAISNGVDLGYFDLILGNPKKDAGMFEKYHLDPKLPIILHVGRLDADKQVDVLIRAAAQVMNDVPAQLLVVGDGECREYLVDLSKQLGIFQHSHFPGFVDWRTDLPSLYRIAAVFTTASEIETQGLVLLEAMASGLPIVAVDATCIHEVVKHQVNGYLVTPGDEYGIARGLTDILQYPARARQMGEAGRSIVQSHSIQDSLDQHETLYREIILRYPRVREKKSIENLLVHSKNQN
jgi:glycosyltransferase involved in cell wall biosynthesis